MSWRTVVITKRCKLSYKSNYLVIRGEDNTLMHLSEIGTILIDSTLVSITSYLICELVKRKIKIVFCDEKRNPHSEIIPYYGSHNSSKRILKQTKWEDEYKEKIWTSIVKQKINNQSSLLKFLDKEEHLHLSKFELEVKNNDSTNREGHAAKVYFNSLFGKQFTRDMSCSINSALNYGYSIILSSFNKEIVAGGYLTQLGINHRNEFNHYNFSCDLMEPFRILVDEIVYENKDKDFDIDYKMILVNLLNKKVKIGGSNHYVTQAIQLYTRGVIDALNNNSVENLPEFNIHEI